MDVFTARLLCRCHKQKGRISKVVTNCQQHECCLLSGENMCGYVYDLKLTSCPSVAKDAGGGAYMDVFMAWLLCICHK